MTMRCDVCGSAMVGTGRCEVCGSGCISEHVVEPPAREPVRINGKTFDAYYLGWFRAGISGTRKPTGLSVVLLRRFLRGLATTFTPSEIVIVQGGCVGIDQAAIIEAFRLGLHIHTVLPADRSRVCPEWKLSTTYEEGGAYRMRNQRVVDRVMLLGAFPADAEGAVNSRRSGTWQTVRMARRAGIVVAERLPISDGRLLRVPGAPAAPVDPAPGTPGNGPG